MEKRDYPNAFKYLELAANAAPYWAEPLTERGYLFGVLKDFPAAVKAYEQAIKLAEGHPGSAYIKPLALRGLGFVLIELGTLDKAKLAFEESLQLEPGNELALGELEYIRRLETGK